MGLRVTCFRTERCSVGINVAKKNERRVRVRGRQRGLEIREDVEVGDQSGAFIHILVVAPGPVKCFSRGALQTLQINVLMFQDGGVFRREIIADDAYQAHRRKVARRERKIAGGAAQQTIVLATGRLDSIERHRTNH